MNRFMGWMGSGLLVMTTTWIPGLATAEMPRAVGNATTRNGPGIRWHETLESGWRESRRRNLPMVIFITSDNCHYCDAMKRDTWCESSVQHRVGQDFVAIRLTPTKNSATLGRIEIEMYPMTLIGMPRGKVVAQRNGYQPPAALHGLLSESQELRLSSAAGKRGR